MAIAYSAKEEGWRSRLEAASWHVSDSRCAGQNAEDQHYRQAQQARSRTILTAFYKKKNALLVAMASPLVHRLGRWFPALDVSNSHGHELHTIVSASAMSFLHTDHDGLPRKGYNLTRGTQPQPCTHMTHPTAASAQANQRPQHAQAELRRQQRPLRKRYVP